MRKQHILCGLLAALLLCLTGCTQGTLNTQNLDWHEQLSPLLRQSSYTVHIQTSRQGETAPCKETTTFFDGDSSHMIIAEKGKATQEVYYFRQNGTCSIYGWDEAHSIWVIQELDDSDNYFYAYSVMERLRKLGGWIDLGEIRYDKNNRTYLGENLSGFYACDGQAHKVLSAEVFIENNKVSSFRELYSVTENGQEQIYEDSVRFEDVGLTQIELPVNCISAEEIAAFDPGTVQFRD